MTFAIKIDIINSISLIFVNKNFYSFDFSFDSDLSCIILESSPVSTGCILRDIFHKKKIVSKEKNNFIN